MQPTTALSPLTPAKQQCDICADYGTTQIFKCPRCTFLKCNDCEFKLLQTQRFTCPQCNLLLYDRELIQDIRAQIEDVRAQID